MKKELARNPREPKGMTGIPKQHPYMHPLHAENADHRKMGMSEKYNGTGPGIEMPKHQHPLHHPHTDVSEKHNEREGN